MWLSGFCTGETGFVRIVYRQTKIYQGHVQAFHDLSGSFTGRLEIIRILSSFPLPYYSLLNPIVADGIEYVL